eukprot:424946_1
MQQIIITENDLCCDINKCHMYPRNNRDREHKNDNYKCEDNIMVYIDIMDSIHCFFVHCVDIGYRITKKLDVIDEQKQSKFTDLEMKALKKYLQSKKTNFETIRGQHRFSNNKFSTQIKQKYQNTNNDNQHVQELEEENKKNIIKTNIIKNGYLRKVSLDLKHFGKRWVVLKNQYLYCHKDKQSVSVLERIDLKQFTNVRMSENGSMYQFELVSFFEEKKQIFIADSVNEMNDWINKIKYILNQKELIFQPTIVSATQKDVAYSYGNRYDYWSKKRFNSKYNSLKFEITNNLIFPLEMSFFNDAYRKAEFILNSSKKLQNMKSIAVFQYCIDADVTLNINNILSLVLYTDYDILSYNLTKTFRKLSDKEAFKETERRNAEYWNWSKLLIETVNCYGEEVEYSNVSVFYHGVSTVYFDSFVALFNSPTSTTTKLSVATIFAKDDGIVLELTKQQNFGRSYLRYFNCSYVSCFGYEDERLFIQPPDYYYLEFTSIRNMSTNEIYKDFISSIKLLDKVIDAQQADISYEIS